jgi:hypothetical protein
MIGLYIHNQASMLAAGPEDEEISMAQPSLGKRGRQQPPVMRGSGFNMIVAGLVLWKLRYVMAQPSLGK